MAAEQTKPKSRNRWPRYSLRTMMLAVTVFCVWLGLETKRARDQERTVATIERLGGTVYYDFHCYEWDGETVIDASREPSGPSWLRDWLGRDLFHHVRQVEGVELFAIPQARSGFESLARMPLVTEFSKHIDENMVYVAALHDLETLDLSYSGLTDAGLKPLESLTNLKLLLLIQTEVTDEGVKRLQQALPRCKIFVR